MFSDLTWKKIFSPENCGGDGGVFSTRTAPSPFYIDPVIINFLSKVSFRNYLITAMFKIRLSQQVRGTLTTAF